jgi:hypothetical protein
MLSISSVFCNIKLNGRMVMCGELVKVWKEVVEICFKVLFPY